MAPAAQEGLKKGSQLPADGRRPFSGVWIPESTPAATGELSRQAESSSGVHRLVNGVNHSPDCIAPRLAAGEGGRPL